LIRLRDNTGRDLRGGGLTGTFIGDALVPLELLWWWAVPAGGGAKMNGPLLPLLDEELVFQTPQSNRLCNKINSKKFRKRREYKSTSGRVERSKLDFLNRLKLEQHPESRNTHPIKQRHLFHQKIVALY